MYDCQENAVSLGAEVDQVWLGGVEADGLDSDAVQLEGT